jgi:hypothetical protein
MGHIRLAFIVLWALPLFSIAGLRAVCGWSLVAYKSSARHTVRDQ